MDDEALLVKGIKFNLENEGYTVETAYDGAATHLPTLWVAVRASLREVLDGTSLEQLRTGALPSNVVTLSRQPDAWQNR